MKKNSKSALKSAANAVVEHRINALVPGRSTNIPGLGVVKCTRSASSTRNHVRKFSLSGSKVAENRGGYTFGELKKAFGLRG